MKAHANVATAVFVATMAMEQIWSFAPNQFGLTAKSSRFSEPSLVQTGAFMLQYAKFAMQYMWVKHRPVFRNASTVTVTYGKKAAKK